LLLYLCLFFWIGFADIADIVGAVGAEFKVMSSHSNDFIK